MCILSKLETQAKTKKQTQLRQRSAEKKCKICHSCFQNMRLIYLSSENRAKRAKVSRFTHRVSSFLSPLKAFFSLIKIYVSHKKNIKDITKRITKKIEQEDHLFRDIFSPLA